MANNNTLLISMQNPNAILVVGYSKWRDQFSRNVKRGEKGIKIIAPTPYKVKKEQEKVDPVTKAPMFDTNGKVITEEVEVKIPLYREYRFLMYHKPKAGLFQLL